MILVNLGSPVERDCVGLNQKKRMTVGSSFFSVLIDRDELGAAN